MREKNLLIATNNKGKLKEIRAILKDLEVQLLSPTDLDLELEVVRITSYNVCYTKLLRFL